MRAEIARAPSLFSSPARGGCKKTTRNEVVNYCRQQLPYHGHYERKNLEPAVLLGKSSFPNVKHCKAGCILGKCCPAVDGSNIGTCNVFSRECGVDGRIQR